VRGARYPFLNKVNFRLLVDQDLDTFHKDQRDILLLLKVVSFVENVSDRDAVNELRQYSDQINATKIFDAHFSNELD
jgi:hypothetical protein